MATKRDVRRLTSDQGHLGPTEGGWTRKDQLSDAGKRWQEENAESAEAWSAWVEKNGLPLAKYRQF